MSKNQVKRLTSRVAFVHLSKMRVREKVAQRELRPAHADHIFSNFSLERMGMPVVNHVGEWFWIVDGQHRIAAMKMWLGDDWESQQIECLVYEGLSEKQEADLFLSLNDTKQVNALEKYRSAITAGHADETNTDAIVRKAGFRVGKNRKREGEIACVSSLLKVYRMGPEVLDEALKIIGDAFGDAGLDSDIVEGVGQLVARYDGALDRKRAVGQLSSVRGGVSGIRNRAERLRQQMGGAKAAAIAAAMVESYNRGKGKKLASWWQVTAE